MRKTYLFTSSTYTRPATGSEEDGERGQKVEDLAP